MKFVDGVTVTYVKKDEKSKLTKILNEVSKIDNKTGNQLYK